MISKYFKFANRITGGFFLLFMWQLLHSCEKKIEELPIVKVEQIHNRAKYVFQPAAINPDITNTPLEVFDVTKRKNALRIINLGGTAASGFPYEVNATYSFQLQFRLRNALLDNYIEVVNLAVPGISSSRLLGLMPQILALQPDQLIFHLGDDELQPNQDLEKNDKTLKVFSDNYQQIIELAQKKNTQVLLSSLIVGQTNGNNLNDFNRTARQVAQQKNVPFVDLNAVFEQAIQNKKRKLFDTHGYLTDASQRLIAQAYFQALYRLQFSNPLKELAFQDSLLSATDIEIILNQYFRRKASVTSLDLSIGKLKTTFVKTDSFPQNQALDEIFFQAKDYIIGKSSWQDAHYNLAQKYIAENKFEEAFKEYRAVNLSYYDDYVPHMKIADLFFVQQQYQKSRLWLGRSLERDEKNSLLNFKMGQTLLFLNNFNQALQFLEKSTVNLGWLKNENIDPAYVFYLTALCYANLKDFQSAEKSIVSSLKYNPSYKPALLLKEKMIPYK